MPKINEVPEAMDMDEAMEDVEVIGDHDEEEDSGNDEEDDVESVDDDEDLPREEARDDEGEKEPRQPKPVNAGAYIPGVCRKLRENEELQFDPTAYKMLHNFETDWPCLSFDVVEDTLGNDRSTYPMEAFIVAGTQADKLRSNQLLVMGLRNLTQMDEDDEPDPDEETDEQEFKEKEPRLHTISIPHFGAINRIKSQRLGESTVVAVWNDREKVQLWNVSTALTRAAAMDSYSETIRMKDEKPIYSFSGHSMEGYALSWSKMKQGDLASGGNDKSIFLHHMKEGGEWVTDHRPFRKHKSSVEDIQFSPTEAGLLVSCSSDKSIRLWDTRVSPTDACVCTVENAHDDHVNVLSWNANEPLIVTGGDDATLKVWSLKTIQFGQPVAKFKHHTAPITSVEWHPQESTSFMASGEDDQVTVWDIATEADSTGDVVEGVPPQLMFLHLGQSEVKEVHWHPQATGMAITTGLSGFNVFKTINY